MVNKVTLIGNLGRDPELFQTQNGRAVARLSIATNEVWMKDGERQRRTEWHRCAGSGNSDRSLSGNSGRSKQALRSRSTRAKRQTSASPARGRSDRSHDPA